MSFTSKSPRRVLGLFAALCGGLLLLPIKAQANIITEFDSVAPDSTYGGYDWTYTAVLTSDEQIDPAKNAGLGTIYDFGPLGAGGLISTTGYLSSDFVFTFSDSTTPAFMQAPTDNPNLLNIRFTDSAAAIGPDTTLGTFVINSAFGNSRLGLFDGQADKFDPNSMANDTETGNIGSVEVPVFATPLPASMLLMGTGITFFGLLFSPKTRRRERRKLSQPA